MKAKRNNDYYMTLGQISEIMGITAEAVRLIEKKALKKLSSPKFEDRWRNILETIAEIDKIKISHSVYKSAY